MPAKLLNPSEAAAQLGISAKALRLYEERGLIMPARTAVGWRAYDAAQMARAADIVSWRALGLSLNEVARALDGDAQVLERVLAAHELALDAQARQILASADKVRLLRADLAGGRRPSASEIARSVRLAPEASVSFDLPWPWGGERFELRDIGRLNFIVGPLGCGKTRLARKLAEVLPGGCFIGLDRLENGGAAASKQRDADPALRGRVDNSQAAIIDSGGCASTALVILLTALEVANATHLVIDIPEQGLDTATQEALMSHIRHRAPDAATLFLLTRSNAILDLESVGTDEAIILCPANHSPPMRVAPYRGAPGYEAVATCLASPEVRARTEGTIAWRPATSLVEAAASARRGGLPASA